MTAKQDTDVTIQSASYDGLGRRIKKVVTKSGDLDGTTVYYYNGHQIIETRDGSGSLTMQVYHGTRYIDEVVGLRLEHGRVYVHQDANYNVIGLTDLTGRELERSYYSPYGELEVAFDAHFFDYDDDADVDADDLAAATSGGTCWGDYSGDCRRLDADADRDIDAADYTAISNFLNGLSADMELQRVPAATHSQLGNPFAHQALAFDAEIASYQNRERQLGPKFKRFLQRDPLAVKPRGRGGYHSGMNLYEYANGNPPKHVDPSGLASGYSCKSWQVTDFSYRQVDIDWQGHTGPPGSCFILCKPNKRYERICACFTRIGQSFSVSCCTETENVTSGYTCSVEGTIQFDYDPPQLKCVAIEGTGCSGCDDDMDIETEGGWNGSPPSYLGSCCDGIA